MTSRKEEENDNTSRDQKSEYLPQADRERDESLPPPPGNENIQAGGPMHAEPPRLGPIGLNQGDEQRRSILEALQQRQYYKDEARMFSSLKGQLTEESVTAIVQHLHGIDSDSERFLFMRKEPGRMLDGDKWTRTDVDLALHDWIISHQVGQPATIRDRSTSSHPSQKGKQFIRSYNVENRDQGTSSRSRQKYGYLPQLYEELDSSMPGFLGNSEEVEGFLVGGKEKLQEIRRELSCRSRARS